MIAGLPMYDWAELEAAHDAFWALIRDHLRAAGAEAPETLHRGGSLWALWEAPDLVLGQTCGMPYRQRLHGKVALIGALDYGLEGCPAGHYNSLFVTRRGDSQALSDYASRTLAFNGQDSQSGWAAAQNHAHTLGWSFTHTLHTGAHRASAEAVANGKADIACIDAVTWRLICRYRADTARALQVIGATDPTPGLPLITAPLQDVALLRAAIGAALEALDKQHLADLTLTPALCLISAEQYCAVPNPPPPTQDSPAT